jgi:hypothetical protein
MFSLLWGSSGAVQEVRGSVCGGEGRLRGSVVVGGGGGVQGSVGVGGPGGGGEGGSQNLAQGVYWQGNWGHKAPTPIHKTQHITHQDSLIAARQHAALHRAAQAHRQAHTLHRREHWSSGKWLRDKAA